MTNLYKFILTSEEVSQLMWLVESNSAYERLGRVLQIQIDQQED